MKTRGFTLIELLVVISIISILASIVLAALNTVRANASLAAGKAFASGLDRQIGSQAIGWWDFDEGSGSVVADRSGSGNTGAAVGTLGWSTSGAMTPGGSITFCTSGCPASTAAGYVSVPTSSSLDGIGSSSLTVSFWLNPNTLTGANHVVIEKSDSGLTGWGIYVDSSNNLKARFSVTNGGDVPMTGSYSSRFSVGVWKHVSMVLDRTKNTVSWYLNGALINTAGVSVALGNLNSVDSLHIGAGSAGYGVGRFGGSIDNVRLFASPLTASEIGKLYATEASRFKLAEK